MTRIAFLGTGIMGAPMAARLAAAGFPVTAWNRSPEKLASLAGLAVAPTARAAVERAEVVVCMLSSGQVCDAVLLGPEGAVAAMAPGATLVVMSSIPVETARAQAAACAERGLAYVDAPVSGGERGAKDGTLAIMAGGDAGVVEALAPLFAPLGRPTHVGTGRLGSAREAREPADRRLEHLRGGRGAAARRTWRRRPGPRARGPARRVRRLGRAEAARAAHGRSATSSPAARPSTRSRIPARRSTSPGLSSCDCRLPKRSTGCSGASSNMAAETSITARPSSSCGD